MVYIASFIIVPLLAYFANKEFECGQKKMGIFLTFLCILVPSFIAGVRSLDVGKDITSYVIPAIKRATTLHFMEYMSPAYDREIGYKIFVYICTRFSTNTNFTLFMSQFITVFFVALFAYKYRKNINMGFTMLIYMLAWFCYSITFMRQSIAIAIIIYSILFFREKKYVKTLLLFLLACSFHSAAVITIVIYAIIYIFEFSNFKKNYKTIIYILSIITLSICVIFFKEIIYFFTNILEIFPYKYYEYTQSYLADSSDIHFTTLAYEFIWIFLAFFYKKFANQTSSKINIDVICLLLFIDLAMSILSHQIVNLDRVGLYFFYPALFYFLPEAPKALKNQKKDRLILYILIIIILFGYWFFQFIIKHWCDTYPYYSDIFPFLR